MNVELTEKQKIKVASAADVYPIMREILVCEEKFDIRKEHFWVIGLGLDQRILYIELVTLGTVSQTTVTPNEVMELASIKLAVRMILVHNHPGGSLEPSENDKDITDRLIQAAKILHKEVLDHLIITPEGYYSFKDDGLMDILGDSIKWVMPYLIKERAKKMVLKREKAGGNQKNKWK